MTIDGLAVGLFAVLIGCASSTGFCMRPWFDILGTLQKTALVLAITGVTACSAYFVVMNVPLMFHLEAFVVGLVIGTVIGGAFCFLSAIARPYEQPRSPSYFYENPSDTLH